MAQPTTKSLHTSLDKLQISTPKPATTKKSEPADSWEDEAEATTPSSEDDTTPIGSPNNAGLEAPPPTPSSPSQIPTQYAPTNSPIYRPGGDPLSMVPAELAPRKTSPNTEDKRPEKSTAVASRLIAAGIGQKAPKRTKEQREYEQAMKVQEKKRRDAVKAEEERKRVERERAVRDVWGD
ncbi:uncharacterized protein LTR77_009503 [Saxophila tyrrhenica]|uniref:Uncharacterized protein n=1 Tax=Saxophila tyrrhenica TaxID=1690608 RepID=A0AAV9NXV1_9PEZI|nr:hypothetical protein LTR77_009503 [Saxophila tyrrhenica]